jgi:nucleoid DNA-binding protein
MADPIKKGEFVRRLSLYMKSDEKTAEQWLDGITDTLYETFKEGHGLTLPGFGGFYLERHHDSTAFKFNPGQKLKKLFGWSSTYNRPI